MKTVQYTYEITSEFAHELDKLQDQSGLADHRELLASMVALWRWAAMRSGEGKAIVAMDEVSLAYNELRLLGLETLKMDALAEKALKDAGLSPQ